MTKWVFVALLAINAGYLAWGLLFGSQPLPEPPVLEATTPGIPTLTLLQELPGGVPEVPLPAAPAPTPEPARSIAPPAAMQPLTALPPKPIQAPVPAVVAPMATTSPSVTVAPAPMAQVTPTPLTTPPPAVSPEEAPSTGLPQPVRVAPATAVAVCYSFGPFPKSFLASKASVRLEEMGVKIDRRTVRDRQQVGYWIYLPPQASKQAAVRKTQELAAKKVDDFFIVLASKYQNAISLGVYKNRNGAERRLAELREKGFEALMEPRYQPINVYWLDVGGHLTERQWNAVREEYPAQRRETVTCGG